MHNQGTVFLKKHFTGFSKFGLGCPNFWWPNVIKTVFYKLPVKCSKDKTCRLLLEKNVQNQQATNQQRTKTE